MESVVRNKEVLNLDFWKSKRVLLTGHTGFKGSWMSLALLRLGAEVQGISLSPNTTPSLFDVLGLSKHIKHKVSDIRNIEEINTIMQSFQPEIVIHMAAQPLVRKSYDDPIETYSTNVMGTVNLLHSAQLSKSLLSTVVVTTDKCYENNEWVWGYRENDSLGGFDPYSNSKACAELVCSAYRNSFYSKKKIGLATARAGNVIGGGDWSVDRLIPDILKSVLNKSDIEIRSPKSIRPWQHVIEPVYGYLMLAENMALVPKDFSEPWNFGPNDFDAKSVEYIAKYISSKYKNKFALKSQQGDHPHEASYLKLDISKTRSLLGWEPKWSLETALDLVLDWNDAFLNRQNMYEKSMSQLDFYERSYVKKE